MDFSWANRSKGTEMLNSTPWESGNSTILSLKKAASFRDSRIAEGNRERTASMHPLMNSMALWESWMISVD
jgi:hypothetical protein